MKHSALCILGIGITIAFAALGSGSSVASSATPPNGAGFIANGGQIDSSVLYYAPGGAWTLYCTQQGLVLDAWESNRTDAAHSMSALNTLRQPLERRRGRAILIRFEKANPAPRIEGEGPAVAKMNFYLGDDPSRWHVGVPTFERVVYRDLWPGIDLAYERADGRIACTIRATPGADLSRVRFHCEGADADRPILGIDGSLDVSMTGGANATAPPAAPESVLRDAHLQWSTFLGSTGEDMGWSVALDGQEEPLVTGVTFSSHFPTTLGAYDRTYHGYGDVFVSKLSADGSTLLWSTYLGGSSTEGYDYGYAIAVNAAGDPIVTGYTWSVDFPVTQGAYDTLENGYADAYVTMLDAGGGTLRWSTFLGGESHDIGYDVHFDSEGNPIVAGRTLSFTFPTTVGAYDETPNGEEDGFVTAISSIGDRLLWSTFLGGSAYDGVSGIDIDRDGSPLLVGYTASPDFPGGSGSIGGLYDVFTAKLSPLGNNLLWSRVIGGGNYDYANDIALDSHGNAVICGETGSSDFPVTAGAYDESYNGDDDVFVTKLSGNDGGIQWSTFLGGSAPIYETGFGIGIDRSDRPVVVGSTPSPDFPVTADAFDRTYNGGIDAFVSRLSSSGTTLEWSTFLGGGGDDYGWYIALNPQGSAVVVGEAGSVNFPTTVGAYDTSYNGDVGDVFIAKLAIGGNPAEVSTGSPAPESTLQVLPNPVRGEARLVLTLGAPSEARIVVLDTAGRIVRRLAGLSLATGGRSILWDGRDDAGRQLPSGRYYVRVSRRAGTETRAFTIVR